VVSSAEEVPLKNHDTEIQAARLAGIRGIEAR
jgi:hypothetical protein